MSDRRLLAGFAHPDDETFRAGGTLALLAKQGVHIQVLTATRGQAGSCGDPPLCSPEDLPAVREEELRCACHTLGLAEPILLNYEDTQLSEIDPQKIVADVLAVIRDLKPQIMISFGKEGLSGHPDHIAIGRIVTDAFKTSGDVCSLYHLVVPRSIVDAVNMRQIQAVPDDYVTLTVDVSAVWAEKMAAIRCHRTQISQSPILEGDQRKQQIFLGTEHFHLAASRTEKFNTKEDLLSWLAN